MNISTHDGRPVVIIIIISDDTITFLQAYMSFYSIFPTLSIFISMLYIINVV